MTQIGAVVARSRMTGNSSQTAPRMMAQFGAVCEEWSNGAVWRGSKTIGAVRTKIGTD